ncbi:hypothetical protein N0V90_008065 [Kalmusia sp. IMI 367209]|nr:hypothetical protein N0V90_008065 [Kalmusia sp. IMI 367209]
MDIKSIKFAHFASVSTHQHYIALYFYRLQLQHAANKATTGVDLTPWGYSSGQLPKVYNIIPTNGTFEYDPDASYNVFKETITGKRNVSEMSFHETAALSAPTTNEPPVSALGYAEFKLYGHRRDTGADCYSESARDSDPSSCWKNDMPDQTIFLDYIVLAMNSCASLAASRTKRSVLVAL